MDGPLFWNTLEDAAACATDLLQKGFQRVVITLGARGSLFASQAGHIHVEPFSVTAVDTTGAGDAFIGSLSVFLAEGMPETDALARANLYAALSTTRRFCAVPTWRRNASRRNLTSRSCCTKENLPACETSSAA